MIEGQMFRARLKKGVEEQAFAAMQQEHAGHTLINAGLYCQTKNKKHY